MNEGCARTDRRGRSGRLQGLVAEFSQDVEAAFEQFAGECEAGAVAAESLGRLVVVGTVRAAGPARRLSGLVERPAQGGWPLTGEMAGRAALIRLMDRDV